MTFEHANSDRLATLGGRIKAARVNRGLTTDDVAEKLDVSRSAVSTWETGKVKNPPEKKLKLFAELTDTTVEWLKHAEGDAPSMTPQTPGRHPTTHAAASEPIEPQKRASLALVPQPAASLPPVTAVTEIKAQQTLPTELDMTPKAEWSIPHDVLTTGFGCDDPDQTAIKRVMNSTTMPDGTVVERGDYFLLDCAVRSIRRLGIYYVADPDGHLGVRRIKVTENTQGEVVVFNEQGVAMDAAPSTFTVLGRVAAVFHGV